MFLFINPEGTRHILFEKFSGFSTTRCDKMKSGSSFRISILNPGTTGKYDLVLTYIRESVSGKEYYKGVIIHNPQNTDYPEFRSTTEDPMVTLFNSLSPKKYSGMQVDIVQFFPDHAVNGHIPKEGIPESIMDDYTALKEFLDEKFKLKVKA